VLILLIILLVIIFLGIMALSIRPDNSRRNRLTPFIGSFFSYRGLYGEEKALPENTIPAFGQAVAAGYGLYLDIRMTKDERVVVFSDERLTRLCGRDLRLGDCEYEWLSTLKLLDTEYSPVLLTQVLRLVMGNVPIVLCLHGDDRYQVFCSRLAEILGNYHGDYCVVSSSPQIVGWWHNCFPHTLRGQVMPGKDEYKELPWWKQFVWRNCLLNRNTHPDFVIMEQSSLRSLAFRLLQRWKACLVVKNVHSQEQLDNARSWARFYIFEGFAAQSRDELPEARETEEEIPDAEFVEISEEEPEIAENQENQEAEEIEEIEEIEEAEEIEETEETEENQEAQEAPDGAGGGLAPTMVR